MKLSCVTNGQHNKSLCFSDTAQLQVTGYLESGKQKYTVEFRTLISQLEQDPNGNWSTSVGQTS